jgi:hypothetical protein
MHPQRVAARFVKPRNNDDFLSHNNVLEPFHKTLVNFQPDIGRSFHPLPWCLVATFQVGVDETRSGEPNMKPASP